MWTSMEDSRRYQELTSALEDVVRRDVPMRREDRVDPEDLALYLEWLELARGAASSIRPFLDKSSPHALPSLSYEQLESDFRWLHAHVDRGPAMAFAEA
jgi:hypothetical protein